MRGITNRHCRSLYLCWPISGPFRSFHGDFEQKTIRKGYFKKTLMYLESALNLFV